jgi:hypothetical protein
VKQCDQPKDKDSGTEEEGRMDLGRSRADSALPESPVFVLLLDCNLLESRSRCY